MLKIGLIGAGAVAKSHLPVVALALFNAVLLFSGWAMTNPASAGPAKQRDISPHHSEAVSHRAGRSFGRLRSLD